MVSHDNTKFDDHGHCGSGDKSFLVVQEQDFIGSLKSGITIYL